MRRAIAMVVVLGCTSSSPREQGGTLASVRRLAAHDRALNAVVSRSAVRVLPERGAFDVHDGRGATLTLDAHTASGSIVDGLGVYRGFARDADLIVASTTDRFEASALLRSADAPSRYTFELDAHGLDRIGCDGICFGTGNHVRFRIPPAFAIDAAGARHAATSTFEGSTLTITVDHASWPHPVLLDPSIDMPLFEKITFPPTAPVSGRTYPLTAIDRTKSVLYYIGDYDMAGEFASYDGTNWSPLGMFGSIGPFPGVGAAVWDEARSKLVVFGPTGGKLAAWEWDATTGFVAKCAAGSACNAGAPSMPSGIVAVYDTTLSKTVVFNACDGCSGVTLWDGTSFTTKSTSTSYGRVLPAAVWDEGRKRAVLMGGASSGGTVTSDVFEWDSADVVAKTAMPVVSRGGAATYDPFSKRVLLWSGSDGFGTLPFLLEYDGTTWVNRTPASMPDPNWPTSGAEGAVFAFLPKSGHAFLFGGGYPMGGGGYAMGAPDVWQYSAFGGDCTSDASCDSGHCVDGVCCKTACGTCQACNVAGSVGTCTAVKGADDPDTCSSTGTPKSTCDSTGACKRLDGEDCTTGTVCKSGNCIDGFCCESACSSPCDVCNVVKGKCTAAPAGSGGNPSCAPYACDGTSTTCAASCTSDTQCATTAFCKAGACVPDLARGSTCTADTQCATGFCTDGVCCDTACSGPCDVCSATLGATADGTCTLAKKGTSAVACAPYLCNGSSASCPTSCSDASDCTTDSYCTGGVCKGRAANGNACANDTECTSGHCVDGICCDAACTGQCEFCNKGVCEPTVGEPKTGKPACATGGDLCANKVCDGKDRMACDGFVTSGECRPQTCAMGVETLSASCDGSGACPAVQTKKCEPFRCGDKVCKTSCTIDDDCADTYRCDKASGKCIAGSTCKDDHTVVSATGRETDCTPFICEQGGRCKEQCGSSADCVAGAVCDPSGRCVAAQTSDDGGGCTTTRGTPGRPWWILAIALAIFGRRRAPRT